jgi:stage II sporulation protein AB (anti-sigma F factor)
MLECGLTAPVAEAGEGDDALRVAPYTRHPAAQTPHEHMLVAMKRDLQRLKAGTKDPVEIAGLSELPMLRSLRGRVTGRGSGGEGAIEVGETLSASFSAVAESVPRARSAAGTFAAAAGASPQQVEDVRLLVSEAVTNAIQHAYRGIEAREAAAVHLTAMVAGSELWIFVADDGCGLQAEREDASAGLGLGLVWMASFSDELTLHARASGGLEVRLRFSLSQEGVGGAADQLRGSLASSRRPTSPSFSTIT